MRNDLVRSQSVKSKTIFAAAVAVLLAQNVPLAVYAGGTPAAAKKAPMQVPGYAKLGDGAGPATNKIDDAAPAESASNTPATPAQTSTDAATASAAPSDAAATTESKEAAVAPSVDLSPMKLSDEKKSDTADASSDSSTTGSAVLKSTVEKTTIMPKAPNSDGAMDLTSVKEGNVDGKLFKQAKEVSAVPLVLMETPEENSKHLDAARENEKVQVAELWDACLTREPQIQFVIQKLMPTKDHAHAANTMMGMLSTALYGAMGAASMMSPNMGMNCATGMGGSMIAQVLGTTQGSMAKKAKLSETEQIMLFSIIRNTADKLVENYRGYKKECDILAKAQYDLSDLKGMMTDALKGQDPAKQFEMQYTYRKAERDVDGLVSDVKRYRQCLVDMAGNDPVDKLDKEVDAERIELAKQGSTEIAEKKSKDSDM